MSRLGVRERYAALRPRRRVRSARPDAAITAAGGGWLSGGRRGWAAEQQREEHHHQHEDHAEQSGEVDSPNG
jgi:pyruvoyl-dependent arginine decarboxylase (PvlArgDC)